MLRSLSALGVAALILGHVACGSEVTDFPSSGSGSGGSGSGGSGGAPDMVVATVTSTAVTTVVSSSSTSGGGSTCDQACAKLANECGFGDICSQIPQLDCADPTSDCPAACVLDADCAAIASILGSMPDPKLAACVQGCQGGGSGGGGQGGGAPVGNCKDCIGASCNAELQACLGDSACQAFLMCAQPCGGIGMCTDDCLKKNPSDLGKGFVDCLSSKCAMECAT